MHSDSVFAGCKFQFRSRSTDLAVAGDPDMMPHMQQLRDLATGLDRVVEFGLRRGNSSVAFLAAGVQRLVSYDLDVSRAPAFLMTWQQWTRVEADTTKLEYLPACELLLIDTVHTFEQIRAELAWARRVSRYICFHDVNVNGFRDEGDGGPGILPAIFAWLGSAPEWRVKDYWPSRWGMLVCERTDADS